MMKIVVLRSGLVFAIHDPHQVDAVLSSRGYSGLEVARVLGGPLKPGKPLPENAAVEVVREAEA